MAKRTYHLTIEYDKETEEIEYISETLDEETEQEIIGLVVELGSLANDTYFDEEMVKMLEKYHIIGRA